MLPLRRLVRHSAPQFAIALVAAGTWLIGCGDDSKPAPPRGKGGSAGMAGSAGASTGGKGGSGGSPAGGTGGSAGSTGGAMGGSAGTTAGTGGSAGTGIAGDAGMGGEGGDGEAGAGGTGGSTGGSSGSSGTGGTTGGSAGTDQGGQGGEGGEGGASTSMCQRADLDIELVSSNPGQAHDHLPINGMDRSRLLDMINTGSPLTYTLPEEGSNIHDHTLTFTANQLSILRNGGALQMNVTSSTDGPTGNPHTHTYSIDCEP